MYVRSARFEGGDIGAIDAEIALVHDSIAGSAGRGETSEIPPRLAELARRIEVLVDRERGSVTMSVHFDSQEDAREADAIMRAMSPTKEGWGKRVSAEIYEVALDVPVGLRKAA
jgi:hypothetical protein